MDAKLDCALLEVITHISHTFGPKAVLKGGMALRLQGIERSTIDADFCFQPSKSKKDFSADLITLMNKICDKEVESTIDSKKLKIDAVYDGIKIIIEANSYSAFEPQAITTNRIAQKHNLPSNIISIMPNAMSFAHKLGAWLDRRLARDLYDIYIFKELLRVQPDLKILQNRLLKPSYSKLIKTKPKLESITEFVDFLKNECNKLSAEQIEESLSAIIPPEELFGLGHSILIAIRKMKLQ
jgi:predicted nucleotidyltransferase component of viral defense system